MKIITESTNRQKIREKGEKSKKEIKLIAGSLVYRYLVPVCL